MNIWARLFSSARQGLVNPQGIKKGDLVSKPWWNGEFYMVEDVEEKKGLLFLSPKIENIHIPYDLNFDWIVKRKAE